MTRSILDYSQAQRYGRRRRTDRSTRDSIIDKRSFPHSLSCESSCLLMEIHKSAQTQLHQRRPFHVVREVSYFAIGWAIWIGRWRWYEVVNPSVGMQIGSLACSNNQQSHKDER